MRLVLLVLGMLVQVLSHPLAARCVEPRGSPFEASNASTSTNQRFAEPAQAARLSSPTTSSTKAPSLRSGRSNPTASRLPTSRCMPHTESPAWIRSVQRRNVSLDAGRARHDGSTQQSPKSNVEIILVAAGLCIAFLTLVLTAGCPPPWLRSATREQDVERQGGKRRPAFADLGILCSHIALVIALAIQLIRMLPSLAPNTSNPEEDTNLQQLRILNSEDNMAPD